MEEKKEEKKLRYNKYNSFVTFKGLAGKKTDNPKKKINLLYKNKTGINNLKNDYISVLEKVILDLNNDSKKETSFSLTENVIDEINTIEDDKILNYLVHRYRYEIYPKLKIKQ